MYRKLTKFIFFISILFICISSFATPYQVILLRHADKLNQRVTGPALSAKGYVRAVKFTFYFLNHFGEPDFIVAGKPKGKDASIRELQTVGPLVSILSAKNPDKGFNILHPFKHDEYEQLAVSILKTTKFDNKTVLICWRHTKINELAKALGIKQDLPKWPDNDFDSVYVIKYDRAGNVSNFSILHDQYPMRSDVTWDEIAKQMSNMF